MRSQSFVGPLAAFRNHSSLASTSKQPARRLIASVMAFVAVLMFTAPAKAQTLALNPAVTDLYSGGFVNFATTQVTQSTTQTVQLKVTGGAVNITSISVPTSTARVQQFKVGTITGCTLGASNATNTICSIPVTFTPNYAGYQTSPLIAVTTSGTFRFGLNGVGTGPQAVLMPGLLTTVAGNGTVNGNTGGVAGGTGELTYKGDGAKATTAQVYSHGFAFDSLGDLYEAEYYASVVREINTSGVINTVAGTVTTAGGVTTATQCATPLNAPYPTCVSNGANSLALTQATFGTELSDVAFDSAGNLYIADTIEDRVRRVDAVTGIITTIAGTGAISETGDAGAATAATLDVPEAVAIDAQDNIYILDSNAAATANGAVVRFINHATGVISSLAGTQGSPCAAGGGACGDGGPATSATLGVSAAFYVDPSTGHFWVADRDAQRIRFVNFNFATPATAGTISTVAGTGVAGYTGDGGAATSAELNEPHGIWVDPAGDIYISDRSNFVIRFVSAASGKISTLAGGGGTCTPGGLGSCGDGGPANGPLAYLQPDDLTMDVNGNLYIADQQNNAIREIIMNPTTLTFPTVPVGTTSGPLTATLLNIGTAPLIYTLPTTTGPSNALVTTNGPTATASTAYSQTAATTCGPVYSTTTGSPSLAAGSTCNYVVAFTPDTAAGNYTGTLVETDNSAVSQTQTINLVGAATAGTVTIGLGSSANPSTYGQNVTFTATLTGGGVPPTGKVTFTYTPTGSTTPVTIGQGTISTTGGVTMATISTTALPIGVDNIVATYGGDGNYTAGTASTPLAQTVNVAPLSNDSITATPPTSTSGQTVTLVFTVPDGATAPAATTSVTFTAVINGTTTTLGTAAVKGVTAGGSTTYTTTTAVLPVGTDTITGTLTGDTNYASGALTTQETVTQAGSTGDAVTVATNPTIVASSDNITFSIPVTTGTAVPAGTVVFTSGTTQLGTATFPATPVAVTCPSGTGTCYTLTVATTALPLTVAPATSTPVTATFTATAASGYASAAPAGTVVVNPVPGTNDAVTAANATTTVGTADPLTYSIPVVTGAPVPTGTVVFTSGTTALGSATWPATPTTGTCPSGTGTCYLLQDAPSPTNIPLTVSPATSTPITATYTAGAGSGYASAAPTTSVVVNSAGGSGDTLTVANNPTTYGTADPLTFSIPVSSGAPAPAGTVVFTAGTTALGTATWPANPVATGGYYTISVSPTNIPVGAPTTVTATFTATAASGYGSAAPIAKVTVNQVPLSNDGISANPSATTSGSTVTLSFTVPNVNNTPPATTATVTFTYNGTTLGTANLVGTTANGVTTYTTTTTALPVGSDTVTGTFTGDTNYAGGALTTPVAISSNTTTDTVKVATNPTTVGSSDTITFSIPVTAGAAAPTGVVAFTSGSTSLGNATWPAGATPTGGFYTISVTTTALPLTVAPSTSTPVLATYVAGNTSGYSSATATTTVVVNQVSGTTDTVTAASGTITVGSADPLTFSIPVVTGAPVPTGTVTFTSGSTALGSATWPTTPTTGTCPGGTGTCYLLLDSPAPTNIPLTVAPSTSTPITATYVAGSGSGYASATPTTQVAVNAAGGTGDTLAVANNPTTFGTADPLTFSIPVVSGAPAPAGTVTFTSGTTALGAATWPANPTPTNGFYTISVSPTNIPVGAPTTVTGTFAPTAASGYGAGTASTTVTVNKVPLSNDGIAANPSATTSGSTVTLTFTVPNVNSTPPTGTVTFSYNGTTLGTANLTGTTANGTTTYTTTTTTLPVGTDTVTGTFTGDGDYVGGALTTPVAISSNTTTDTVSVATNPTTVGSSDTITFSIPVTAGAAVPTGTVAFTSGSTNLGSATWPGTPTATGGFYTLSITTTALPLTVAPSTSTPVLATFTAGGTSGYSSATATATVVVNQVAGSTDAVTAANSTITVGSADPLTFSIPVVTGAPVPTGTVNFTSGTTALGSATWPATPTTGTCPGGAGTCYLLADSPSPTNIPLTVPPATSTPITATYVAGSGSGYASSAPTTAVDVTPVGGTGGTLTIANNPTTYGTADPMTFSLPVTNGVPAPAGTVVFTAGGVTLGTATFPANPTATGGAYTLTINPTNTPVGSPTTVTATFTPSAGSGYGASTPTANVTVNKVPVSNDSITATPNPTTSGSTVTLTFTVPNVNGTAPTGTVTFTYNGTTLGTANIVGVTAGGTTTYTTTTTTLPVGTDPVTGTFSGDTDYANGALTTNETITQANGTSDTVTVATNPTTVGSSDTITFTIPVVTGATAPSGTVVFTSGTTNLGSATWPATPTATGGVYTLSITTTALPLTVAPATSTPVLATYTAGTNSGYGSANPTTTVVVNQVAGATDAVTVANNPTTVGAADPLTFSIPVVTGAPAPAGTVTFTSGGTALGSATWPATPVTGACPVGGGTCYLLADAPSPTNIPLTVAPATSTPISATFLATAASGYGSDTATTTVVVNAANGTGDTLTVANNPTTYGTADPLTFSIPVSAGAPAPTGTVTFTAGTTALGTATWPAGATPTGGFYTISVSPTNIPVGSPTTVTATYAPGTGSGYGAAAPTATVTVNTVPLTNDSIAAAPNPQSFGSTVTLTFTVPNVNGTAPVATSTVTFTTTINGVLTTLGSGAVTGVTAGGVTTYTTSTTILPVGSNTITGTFTGDGNYTGGSLTTIENITPSTSGATLTANPNPANFGTPVTLTETITPIGGTCPAGPATFLNGGVSVGTGTISLTGGSCVATLTTSTLPVGTDSITATVPASGGFQAITSGPVNVTINKAPGTGDTLTTNPNPSTFGQTVTITETLPTVGGVAPTGTVTFFNNGTSIGTGNVSNGVATLTTTTLPLGTDPITATYGGDGNYATVTSGPVNQVVNSTNGSATLAANPNPTTFGTPVTLTETIVPVNNTCPTGPATFLDNGTAIGTGAISLTGGSCVATLVTSTLPVGTDAITATVPAGNGFTAISSGPVNVQVGKAAGVGDTLTTNPNPSIFGNPVTITETLPTVGGVAPTGTVTFFDNGTSIGTAPVTNGVATINTSTLPEGTDPITATYTGDGNYATVTSGPVNQVVTNATGSATLAAGPNPATFGTPVTLTETIAPINGACPAGPTTFYNNGTAIGTGAENLVNGSCVATLTTSTLPVGTDSITATVPASNGFVATTSGPVALVINPANSPDTLTSSPNPSVFGNPVVITDTIPIAVTGVPPTGTVNFYDFTTLIGTGVVNAQGVATITTSTLPVGTDSLTGVYLGDPNYAQVTTAPVNQIVTAVSTTATLAVGPNPTNFGTLVTVTETIPVTNGTPATGTVTFFSNGTQIGTGTLKNGVATITSTTLPVGTDQITATYNGDTNYSAVTSGPVAEIVNTANGADTLTVAPDPAVFGTPVVITDTIPTVGGVAPTGTVTFYDNGTSIGTGTVNAQGVATLTTTTLPVGSDPITASYGGDPNYAPVTSGPVNEIITVGNTTPVLGATPNPTTFGTTVTLTESIPGINGITPTGTVQFYDNGTPIGTPVQLVNGVATLPVSTLPIGTDPITATYSGDGTYATVTSGPLNVVINKAAPTDTLTANPNPSTFGSPVTLTFTVPPVNGVPPTGTVSFYNGTTLLGTGTINASGVATITTSALPFGTDTVTATYPGDNNYAPANPSVTIAVNPVAPTSVLTGPTGTPACGSSVTLTDTITPVNGVALGGTVQFFVNGVAFGNPIPVPASGVVTLTTTSLPCVTDTVTAVYTPPAGSPYLPSTGGPTTVSVLTPDFSIAATPANQTINPGDSTTYTVSLSGVGAPFTSPVTLTATCSCQGVTINFANSTITPGAGPTSTTMTVTTAPNFASAKKPGGGANGIYYGLLLLPLLGIGRIRRKLRSIPKGIQFGLAALLLLGGLGAMTGCGGGYYGPAPTTCTVTVTGTSGSLSHSTTVTLTVR